MEKEQEQIGSCLNEWEKKVEKLTSMVVEYDVFVHLFLAIMREESLYPGDLKWEEKQYMTVQGQGR